MSTLFVSPITLKQCQPFYCPVCNVTLFEVQGSIFTSFIGCKNCKVKGDEIDWLSLMRSESNLDQHRKDCHAAFLVAIQPFLERKQLNEEIPHPKMQSSGEGSPEQAMDVKRSDTSPDATQNKKGGRL